MLPPKIFTKIYSINFAQIGNQNFATFKPTQKGGIMYKTLYAKGKTMPSGTPLFEFFICGSLETALFDTGTPISLIDAPTFSKIAIYQSVPAENLFGKYGPAHVLLPIALPFTTISIIASTYVLDKLYPPYTVPIVSAAQFLDNGIEFTLNEDSASFSTLN